MDNISPEKLSRALEKWQISQIFAVAKERSLSDPAKFLERYDTLLRRRRATNPRFFDEIFYLSSNPDVLGAALDGNITCGLHHFLGWGFFEGRAPNVEIYQQLHSELAEDAPLPPGFDKQNYLAKHPRISEFLTEFDGIFSAESFAQKFGFRMGHFAEVPSSHTSAIGRPPLTYADNVGSVRPKPLSRLKLLQANFDAKFYKSQHPDIEVGKEFEHYLRVGMQQQHSPNANFDEKFYLAFYQDVAVAVDSGDLRSGFEHFLVAGANEGRIPQFDLLRCLEAVYAGVTRPNALSNITVVEHKLEPCSFEVDLQLPPTIWLVLPFLNADLMFGGFTSLLEFIEQALERKLRLGIFLRESQLAQIEFFKFRGKSKSRLHVSLDSMRKFSALSGEVFRFSEKDLFVSYSVWDGLWARVFASQTKWKIPVYWIQEYEPIFHAHDAFHFLSNSAYFYDHVGVFNSKFLRSYFVDRKIGIYARPTSSRALSYEHLLWRSKNSRPARRRPKGRRRVFFLYARPEDHAARNLMPIAVYALKLAIKKDVFRGDWDFVGMGALAGPYRIGLGNGADLDVRSKVPPEEYSQFLSTVDIGMSLMYAPHPSLLPYELARAGAVVVTNEFETRDSLYIQGRDPSIVVFRPFVDDCVRALEEAVRLTESSKRIRSAGNRQEFPDSSQAGWADIFDESFFFNLAEKIDAKFRWDAFGSAHVRGSRSLPRNSGK